MAFSSPISASETYQRLQTLRTVGSALYVAAHPDDENTTLLSYLALEEKLDTAYLSLTRGGGGQNLIGPELKEELGVIRANELLQARKIDGATQLFTRARDFGYSKNPEDTLENWQEEKVLGDVVYAVRYFRPDIIITRFNPEAGPTHGHHTVSAQLAVRAFSLAADPSAFPEQLDRVSPHQAERIFWNGYGQRGPGGRRGDSGLQNERREIVSLDIGIFNPILGASYTEISARSRSMHKSQGFGRAARRGPQTERLVLLDGAPAEGDYLKGVDTSWSRYPGGDAIDAALARASDAFEQSAPWKTVPMLVEADALIEKLPDSRRIRSKRAALRQLIADCLGLHLEARSESLVLFPGENGAFNVELVNRSPVDVRLVALDASLFQADTWPRSRLIGRIENLDGSLALNQVKTVSLEFNLPENAPLSQPYWLEERPSSGIYHFANDRLLELESVPSPINVAAIIEVEGRRINLDTGLIQVISDPVEGEVRRPVAIRPEITISPIASLSLFPDSDNKTLEVSIGSNAGDFKGMLEANGPDGWGIEIENPEVALDSRISETTARIRVTPPSHASEGFVEFAVVSEEGKRYSTDSKDIEYDHIGTHPLLFPSRTKLTRLELERGGSRIACIKGVGDTVPEILTRIGYEVEYVSVEEISTDALADFDTVLLGHRAFDSVAGLDKKFDELLAYVENGGTLISQYNTTSFRTKSQFTAPYPIRLSRERVSEESVEMRVLKPDHPVFNTPNRIASYDFDNWIQERGLYYATSWDDAYEALVSANDRGEPPRDGGLLVAPYGKGWYAYTGLSFFRQLPEGNPGAIRLFVNLISLGHGK